MQLFKMEVSRTVEVKNGKNYRATVGAVDVTVPTLLDIVSIVALAKVDTDAMAKEEKDNKEFDGLPIYTDAKADWIFGAMLAAVKAGARNKLAAGSIELKSADNPIPDDWEGIVAIGERGGAAAFAILKEVKQLWVQFVAKLGKSEATSATLIMYFNSKQALLTQSLANRNKMLKYVEDFAMSISEADAEKYLKPIDAVIATCNEGMASGEDF